MGSCEHKIIADDERPNIRLESLHPTITTTEPDLPMIRGVILPSEVGGSTVKFTMKTREDLRRVVRRPWVTLAVIKFMFAVGILPTQAVAGQVAAAVQKTVEATEHSASVHILLRWFIRSSQAFDPPSSPSIPSHMIASHS